MKTFRTQALLLALAAAVALPRATAAGEKYKVIANPSVAQASLSRDELSRVFLKKTTRWPGGQEIRPVEPRAGAAVRDAFVSDVHQLSAGALRSYWTQMIFSGRDVPPVEKGTDEQIVAYVREHPGAIGYVSHGADAPGLKVLDVR